MPTESMPLAAGYLKATALSDPVVGAELDLDIVNFGGGAGHLTMSSRLFAGGPPDVLACSVLGWNFRAFVAVAETFKQLNPAGWVVFGGTHVAHQADRVLRGYPAVDVIVDIEGEFVFRDLLRAYLKGRSVIDLSDLEGVSYRDGSGQSRRRRSRHRSPIWRTSPRRFSAVRSRSPTTVDGFVMTWRSWRPTAVARTIAPSATGAARWPRRCGPFLATACAPSSSCWPITVPTPSCCATPTSACCPPTLSSLRRSSTSASGTATRGHWRPRGRRTSPRSSTRSCGP